MWEGSVPDVPRPLLLHVYPGKLAQLDAMLETAKLAASRLETLRRRALEFATIAEPTLPLNGLTLEAVSVVPARNHRGEETTSQPQVILTLSIEGELDDVDVSFREDVPVSVYVH